MKADDTYRLDHNQPKSIGRVKAFFGNYGMMLRALAYTLTHGNEVCVKQRKPPCSTRAISPRAHQ